MHSVAEGSTVAAAVAVRILNGEKADSIKTPPTRYTTPKFDWVQMQRWGISERSLSPGSEILFKPPTLWELYRWDIVTIAVVILVQAALILGLLWERRRRRRLEVEGRQRMAELAHMNRQATAGHLSASIAHELNQPLGAILNNAEAAALMIASPSPDLEEIKTILDDIKRDDQRASEVIKRLRRLLTRGGFEPQEVDVNDVVREVLQILSAQAAARDVRLESKLAQQQLRVNGDRVQLQQVILNLIVNGIDAIAEMPNGVREITCRSWAADGQAPSRSAIPAPGYRWIGWSGSSSRSLLPSRTAWAWACALPMPSSKRTAARSQPKPVPAAPCFTSACPSPRHGTGELCVRHRPRSLPRHSALAEFQCPLNTRV